jgi:hypothetical protein
MPTNTPPPYTEKRRVPRARQLRQARCVFNQGSSSLDVTVRDISPIGARIAGDALICLPPTFELQISGGHGGYSARKARLVWSKGATAGVEFID